MFSRFASIFIIISIIMFALIILSEENLVKNLPTGLITKYQDNLGKKYVLYNGELLELNKNKEHINIILMGIYNYGALIKVSNKLRRIDIGKSTDFDIEDNKIKIELLNVNKDNVLILLR